jgi:hypothetical protein
LAAIAAMSAVLAVCGVVACSSSSTSDPPSGGEGEGAGEAEKAAGEAAAEKAAAEAAAAEAAARAAAEATKVAAQNTGTGQDQSEMDCEAEDANCPLFDWMTANTVPAVENRDLPALTKALHQIEFLAPDESWNVNQGENGWAAISRAGAEKAEAGDFRGARVACKACHDQWRDRFRQEGRRTAPMPELPAGSENGRPAE